MLYLKLSVYDLNLAKEIRMVNKKDENKITFILGGMGNGGAERVVSILANYYAKKGKIVDIITLLSSNSTYKLEPNVRIISLVQENIPGKLKIIGWVNGLRRYYKKNRPYRIISFFAKINIVVMLSLLNHIGDLVVSERNDPSKDGRGCIVRFLTRLLYPKTKKVVFQTKWAQSCFSSKVVANSEIVENPVTEITTQNIKKTKSIVNVGKLSDQKNHELLIKAFSRITNEFPNHKLIIYGEGSNRKKLESMINKLELSGKIKLPGWEAEVHKKIEQAELFVLSSDYEGFSNALLEAMMIGIPCISTDCAGSNELIKHNVNGLLTPIGNIDELVSRMKILLNNPRFADKLGTQGKIDVEQFGVSKIVGRWESVIE